MLTLKLTLHPVGRSCPSRWIDREVRPTEPPPPPPKDSRVERRESLASRSVRHSGLASYFRFATHPLLDLGIDCVSKESSHHTVRFIKHSVYLVKPQGPSNLLFTGLSSSNQSLQTQSNTHSSLQIYLRSGGTPEKAILISALHDAAHRTSPS